MDWKTQSFLQALKLTQRLLVCKVVITNPKLVVVIAYFIGCISLIVVVINYSNELGITLKTYTVHFWSKMQITVKLIPSMLADKFN